MSQNFNILLSSSGRRVALLRLFKDSLSQLGLSGQVMIADMVKHAPTWHVADRAFYSPRFTDPTFIDQVLTICKENQIRLLVPTLDPELKLYAKHIEKFQAIGTAVVVSDSQTINIGSDKRQTHQWLASNHFPSPRQTDVEQIISGQNSDQWQFPLLVKPAAGSSSIGVHIVHDIDEMKNACQNNDDYIVETIAPGDEYSVDVYVDRQGKARCAVPRQRLQTRAGEISKGITVRNDAMETLAKRICETLPGPRGIFNIQIFMDSKTGHLEVIEINSRFPGGYPLTHHAGATYTKWLIEEALGQPISGNDQDWKEDVVMLRYDDAVFVSKEDAGV